MATALLVGAGHACPEFVEAARETLFAGMARSYNKGIVVMLNNATKASRSPCGWTGNQLGPKETGTPVIGDVVVSLALNNFPAVPLPTGKATSVGA